MENKRKIIMYFGISLLLINFLCSYSQILSYDGTINTIISIFGILLLLISSYLKKDEKKIQKTLLLLLAFASYYVSKQSGFFQFMVILIALKNENINQIIKFIFKITSAFLLIHIFIYILMYIYNKSLLIFNVRDNEQIVRHMFLFSHANFLGALCSWNCLAYLYINKNELKLKHIFIALLYILFIFIFPNSRTAATILLITIIILVFKSRLPELIKIICKYSVLIFATLSLIAIFLYPNSTIVQNIDERLNARIKLGYVASEVYGIKPFGQNISFGQEIDDYKEMGLSSIVIDSTYYKLLISYGLISFVLLLIIYFIGVKKITLKNDKICFLLPYALFAFMETTGIFPLLSFPILLIDDKENNNE